MLARSYVCLFFVVVIVVVVVGFCLHLICLMRWLSEFFFSPIKKFNSFFHDCVIYVVHTHVCVRMWMCVNVSVNPNKSPYKLHDNLLWTFSNLTRCIFHLTVLTENSSCVAGFFLCACVALYLQPWSHIAVCRRYISRSDLFCRLFHWTLLLSLLSTDLYSIHTHAQQFHITSFIYLA